MERTQILRRALEAAESWGVHRAHREVEKVQKIAFRVACNVSLIILNRFEPVVSGFRS